MDTERTERELEQVVQILKDKDAALSPAGRANILGTRQGLLFALGRVDSLDIGRGIIEG
jgi:hypothetical protein